MPQNFRKNLFIPLSYLIFAWYTVKDGYAFLTDLMKGRIHVMKYVCDVCGYTYDPAIGDPDNGIAPGTSFEELPEDWVCPLCGVGKDMFSKA